MNAHVPLVGREAERQSLMATLASVVAGEPTAVLLHGEPGIGKTSLARDFARAARARDCHVLFGQCLRFGADVTSYVPFSRALSGWLHAAAPADRARALPGVGSVSDVVPALEGGDAGVALFQLGAVVDRLERDRPTVVVIDDLQWSDPSSLDVLTYLIGGFTTGQRLGVVVTYRDTELHEGHRLHGWLADVLRMPLVSQSALTLMDRWDVEQMVEQHGLRTGGASVVEAIYGRSGGNPYLAKLLIVEARDGVGARDGPEGRLSHVLLASWHRLSVGGRRVTRLIAVAGRPVTVGVLCDLAARTGIDAQAVDMAVVEATEHGLTTETDSGVVWFRHPLIAEVIAETLRPGERTELHRAYADAWRAAGDVDSRERANHLALHYSAAADTDAAFTWSLRAAEEAAAVQAHEERAIHLCRAVALLPRLSDDARPGLDVTSLLLQAGRVCDDAARHVEAVHHYEAALARVDQKSDPLVASRILLSLHLLRNLAGEGSERVSLAEPRQALALTTAAPASPERAIALVHLAFAEVFNGLDSAAGHAEAAVLLAENLPANDVLAWALATRAQTKWGTDEGIADAESAMALLGVDPDPILLMRVTVCMSNCYQSAGRYADAAAVSERSYRILRDGGASNRAAKIGAIAARWNFELGRWDVVRPMLRELLTLARSDDSAALVRCTAARLAALEGNAAAAVLHLRRAEELLPMAAPVGDPVADTQIQVSVSLGDPARALELVETYMAEAVVIDPTAADEFLQRAALAAVDLAERGVPGGGRSAAGAWLERIEALRGDRPPRFVPAGPLDLVHPALGALYAARRAQCLGERATLLQLWVAASEATERAGMRYEHARALYYLARAMLGERRETREVASALTKARSIAVELGAAPLSDRIDALAAQAHLHLVEPAPASAAARSEVSQFEDAFALTPREREILGGLVAGDTYSQIASRLFISEKTVSSHVSNILRKTGTTSRIELAVMARAEHRPGQATPPL